MQAVWINSRPEMRSERGVIVFAAGWAGSDELVRHLALPQGYDLLCLFDYRSLPAAAEARELYAQIAPYRHKHLIAWSFGVWAAERIFGGADWTWDGAVAVNGTPLPVHDTYGIPVRAFAVTVRSIEGAGTGRFLERMCGTPETPLDQRIGGDRRGAAAAAGRDGGCGGGCGGAACGLLDGGGGGDGRCNFPAGKHDALLDGGGGAGDGRGGDAALSAGRRGVPEAFDS